MIRKVTLLALCVMFLVAFMMVFSANAATETFDESYQVEPGTKLELRNKNGNVTIRRWDQSQVKVFAKKKTHRGGKLENVKVEVTLGETMNIETIHLVRNPKVSVTYDVQVPAEVIVQYVDTSNGKISLEGTQGDVTVKSSNGKIEIEHVKGNIDAKTSNGKIEIADVDGFVNAQTSNGSVEIKEVTGVRGVKTSNGGIEVEIPAIGDKEVQIKTSNGAVKVYLSPELNANIEIKTSNGKITIEDLEIVASKISKNQVQGELGDGGPKIFVKTSNGKIDLHKLH